MKKLIFLLLAGVLIGGVNLEAGTTWSTTFTLNVYSRAVPSISTNAIAITVAEGDSAGQSIVISNSGNAMLNFSLANNASWGSALVLNTEATPSAWQSGGTALPLNDPAGTYLYSYDSGQSDAASIGFNFPFYGTDYSYFYVDANGAIILSTTPIADNTAVANGDTELPAGTVPLIAPFRDKSLQIADSSPVRYKLLSNPTRLAVMHTNVTLATVSPGTNLQFMTELYADGGVKFSYYNINGGQVANVDVGIQQNGTTYQTFDVVPASGKAISYTQQANPAWVTPDVTSGSIPGLGSQTITYTANAADKVTGDSIAYTETYTWSSGASGSSNINVSADVVTAEPVYSAETNLVFFGPPGEVSTATFAITNTGTGPLNFDITSGTSTGYLYGAVNYSWVDISGYPEVLFNDPDPNNPYLTAGDEGVSSPINLPFEFPFGDGVYTQVMVCMNGALRFDVSNPIPLGGENLLVYTNVARFSTDMDNPSYPTRIPYRMIAPYWADLVQDENSSVRYYVGTNAMVVTWSNVKQWGYNGGSNQTFQVIIYPNGDIKFQYQSISGDRWPETRHGYRYISGFDEDVTWSATYTNLTGVHGDTNLVQAGDATTTINEYGNPVTTYASSIGGRARALIPSEVRVITYSPSSGTIDPYGGTAEITISGDASKLGDGALNATANLLLTINHNGTINGTTNIGPSTLDVTFTATNANSSVFPRYAAASNDSDGDGIDDDDERVAGTDPQDSGSIFTPKVKRGTLGPVLSWPYAEGRTYTVLYTTSLTEPFQVLASGLQTNTYTHETDAPVIYYRVTVE